MTKQEILNRLQQIVDENKNNVEKSINSFMPFWDVLAILEQEKEESKPPGAFYGTVGDSIR